MPRIRVKSILKTFFNINTEGDIDNINFINVSKVS